MATTVANDAFGRLRVGLPETLHDSRLTYDLAPLLWETTSVGTGTCTHLPSGTTVRRDVRRRRGAPVPLHHLPPG